MRALFTTGSTEPNSPRLVWRDDIQTPTIEAPTDALIKPIAVAACDLDRSIALGRSPFPGEFMLGHEFTGEVVQLGDDITAFNIGDIVLASFQPSCGDCPRCGRALTSVCESVPNGSMFGIGETGGNFGGALADLIRVPWADFNLKRVPAHLNPSSLASASDNLADALRCIEGPVKRYPDSSVLIAGRGSIPLYAVLCAQHFGVEQITLVSDDQFALQVADQLGAESLEVTNWATRFKAHDITIDCTNNKDGLAAVMKSTAPFGECTSASIYFGEPVPVPMFNMNMKGISFHTGRANSAAALDRVLELITDGLDPDKVRPLYVDSDQVIDSFQSAPFSQKIIVEMDR